jgi:hypothetical protein
MKRFAAAVALLVALVSCQMDVTTEEKRWRNLEREEVLVQTGYSTMVHAKKECPALAEGKGEVKVYTVRQGRLVDANGLFFGSERERQPLCEKCVK